MRPGARGPAAGGRRGARDRDLGTERPRSGRVPHGQVIHHVPVERCAGILESLSGIRPSDGFVHALLARAAQAVRHVNLLIRALVITAGVICADETPIRVGPGPKSRKRYLLVACTNLLTCYFLGDRTLASFDGFIVLGVSDGTRSIPDDEVDSHNALQARLARDYLIYRSAATFTAATIANWRTR